MRANTTLQYHLVIGCPHCRHLALHPWMCYGSLTTTLRIRRWRRGRGGGGREGISLVLTHTSSWCIFSVHVKLVTVKSSQLARLLWTVLLNNGHSMQLSSPDVTLFLS